MKVDLFWSSYCRSDMAFGRPSEELFLLRFVQNYNGYLSKKTQAKSSKNKKDIHKILKIILYSEKYKWH